MRTLTDRIVRAIGARCIQAGPGGVFDPKEIGVEYDASRTTVREAIRTLIGKGLVRHRQNTGLCVEPIRRWSLLDPDVVAWRAAGPEGAKQAEDLAGIAAALDVAAARDAASRSPDERLHLVKALVTWPDELTAEYDRVFHSKLLASWGNALGVHFAGLVSGRLPDGAHYCAAGPSSRLQHLKLTAAIWAGDVQRATDTAYRLHAPEGPHAHDLDESPAPAHD